MSSSMAGKFLNECYCLTTGVLYFYNVRLIFSLPIKEKAYKISHFTFKFYICQGIHPPPPFIFVMTS